MEPLWATPTDQVGAVIRTVCQRLLVDVEDLADELSGPSFAAQDHDHVLSDAALTLENRSVNKSDIVQWLSSNIQRPGMRVEPYISPEVVQYFDDLASRGVVPDLVNGWRVPIALAWRRTLVECFAVTEDPDVLIAALDIVAQSLAQYGFDWHTAIEQANQSQASNNARAEAIAMIQSIASGAAVREDLAEARLNYRLQRWHQAFAIWSNEPTGADLDHVVAEVKATAAGQHALIARASASSRWLWLSGPSVPSAEAIERIASAADSAQVVAGRPGHGLAGFRSSHLDALAGQGLLVRLQSERKFTEYAEVELVDALTQDAQSASRFVATTLGPLALSPDETLREALLTYVQCGFNATRAAATLYAHRNTIERRVSRANELSAVSVEDNPTHVAAALMVLKLAPDLAANDSRRGA